MADTREPLCVLIVCSSKIAAEKLEEIVRGPSYSPVITVASSLEARGQMLKTNVDILIINTPLPDDNGIKLARDAAIEKSCGVILAVKSEIFEQVSYAVEDDGILTVQKPTTRQAVYQAVKLLTATRARVRKLQAEAMSLHEKMDDIRIVNRAKFILIERLKMSEAEAHRYIEKLAMDTCTKRRVIAEKIIRTYEN